MRVVRGRLQGLVAGAGALAILSACGGGAETPASPTGDVPAEAVIAFPAQIQSLSPGQTVDSAGLNVLNLIGANLFELRGEETVPGIAEDVQTSEDGLTWTLTLRPDLTFSDASELDSKDVVASIEAIRNDPASYFRGVTDPILKATARGADTVVLKLRRPYPSLPKVLAEPFMIIFPSESVGKEAFYREPISAGPYKLESWGGTDTAELVRNSSYWGDPGKLPKITFRTVTDPNTRLQQVQSGQINLAYALPPDLLSAIKAPLEASIVSMYGHETLSMRTTEPPFDELGVRQAVSAALDREKLAETVWQGSVEPLTGFWPSTMPGYDSSISTEADPAAAADYLKGTQCESGCNALLTYSSVAFPQTRLEALLIQADLKKIGIDVQLKDVDATSWYTALGEYSLQMTLLPIYDLQNIPDTMLQYGLLPEGGQQANFTGFETPGVEGVAERAMVSTGAERDEALAEVNDLFTEHVTYASLTDTATIYVSNADPELLSVSPTTLVVVGQEASS